MRRLRYSVAASLDGYIAAPDGGYDWIIDDPTIDFSAFQSFDTMLVGRKTFEAMQAQQSGLEMFGGMAVYVGSRTLDAAAHPGVTVVADAAAATTDLRTRPGKDIWLMGGGELFRSLLEAGLVDGVEVGLIPILLGGGVPLLPTTTKSTRLKLTDTRTYPSGIVHLSYAVERPSV
jgi:dihydrofolate reductase